MPRKAYRTSMATSLPTRFYPANCLAKPSPLRRKSCFYICQSATELGRVVVEMCSQEPKLTKEEIVKERFISLLLPMAKKLTQGNSIDNIRARINDVLARQPRQRSK